MTKAKRPSEKALRKDIVATALAMSRSGLSPGRSGNVSCRFKDGMLITPIGASATRKPSPKTSCSSRPTAVCRAGN